MYVYVYVSSIYLFILFSDDAVLSVVVVVVVVVVVMQHTDTYTYIRIYIHTHPNCFVVCTTDRRASSLNRYATMVCYLSIITYLYPCTLTESVCIICFGLLTDVSTYNASINTW